jgi:hypothetical protein
LLNNEIKISGNEHLKVILQDPSTYLKKATEIKNRISSDPHLPSDYKENFLKEVNSYIEKVEQATNAETKNKQSNIIISLLTHLAAAGLGYHLGYAKKSEEVIEEQQFISDALVALTEELKKYL